MENKAAAGRYQAPSINVVGTVSELTKEDGTHKYTAPHHDYIYPSGFSFDFTS